jgi:hypothetical protein
MSFLPQLFLSNIKAKDGLARPNRFQVILPIPSGVSKILKTGFLERLINLPNSIFSDVTTRVIGTDRNDVSSNPSITRYLALQCESAELPGKSLNTEPIQVYNLTYEIPYQTVYTETSFTFLCTNEFYERKLFDSWMESIIAPDTNNVRFAKSGIGATTFDTYLTNIKIVQYDDFIKQIYAVELIDAFPKTISAQPLSWGDDGFHRVTVQFSYKRFRTIYEGGYDLAAATNALLGGSVAGVPIKDVLSGQIKGTAAAARDALRNPFSIF